MEEATSNTAIPPKNLKMGEIIPENTPIQMATVTDSTGYIHPKWFKFQDENRMIVKIDIERVMCQETVKYAGIFEKRVICSMVVNDIRCVAEFRYNIESQRWRIFQVISS
ncbi:MAG: hypothetical protein IKB01_12450 [Lachnospiraceae bacterium]|nr:hypothetical protein [Lachnospiraceae bacterium]